MVRLYKILKNGDIKFVDFGVPKYADEYVKMGYIVVYPLKRG